MTCRPLEMALERKTVEKEAALTELQAAAVINATRQVQVGLLQCLMGLAMVSMKATYELS